MEWYYIVDWRKFGWSMNFGWNMMGQCMSVHYTEVTDVLSEQKKMFARTAQIAHWRTTALYTAVNHMHHLMTQAAYPRQCFPY